MTQAKNKSEEWRGKIGKMTDEEMAEFLSGNPFCRIGCVADDGWPYVVPCWFEYNDGGFYIVPRAESVWARYIQRDGRVSLCIDDTTIYNNRVIVKGEATVLEEPNLGSDAGWKLRVGCLCVTWASTARSISSRPSLSRAGYYLSIR